MNKLTRKSLLNTALIGAVYLLALLLPDYFVYIDLAMVLLVILIWRLFFNVKLSFSGVVDKAKFLTLPLVFNVGALYLTTIFFQTTAKVIILFFLLLANYFLWISLRKVYNLSDRAAVLHRNVLIVISFLSVFLGSTTIFRLYMLLDTSGSRGIYQSLLVVLIFVLFYLVSSFLIWENGADEDQKKLKPYNVVCSLLGAEIAWISSIWIVNYPVIATQERANLGGTPLPAVLLTIVFYFLWGIVFHKLDNSLTRKVLTEYVFIATIFITVLLATARWLPTL